MRKPLLAIPLIAAVLVVQGAAPAQAESFRAFGVQTIVSPDRPSGVAVNTSTNMVYTVNSGDGAIGHGGSVTVINGTTGAVVGSPIPVGSAPYAIAANPVNNSVYISDSVDGTVTVISGDIPRVTAVISLNDLNLDDPDAPDVDLEIRAHGIAVDVLTNKVYVTGHYYFHGVFELQAVSIWAIDAGTNRLLLHRDIPWRLGEDSEGLAVNPARGLVYVTLPDRHTVDVRDGSTLDRVAEIPALNGARSIGVNPLTNTIYLPDSGGSTVNVVDGATYNVVKVINVGSHPFGVGVNYDTNTIYIPNTRGDSVAVIDGVKNELIGTPINVGSFPMGVAVNPVRHSLFVANQGDSTVSSISERMTPDITSGAPTRTTLGVFYSFTVTAVGSPRPSFFLAGGALPTGLTIDSTTGTISGRPAKAGTYTFTIRAHNATNFDQKKTYTLTVAP